MRMNGGILPGPITPEEIERVKRLRDQGAAPPAAQTQQKQDGRAIVPPVQRGERLNGREQAGLYSLGGANELLADNVSTGLERRLKKLGLWWRFKGLASQLQKIQEAVQESAEDAQIKTIALRCRHTSVYVGMDRVGDPDGTWVRIPDLNVLMKAVLSDTCDLCTKDQAEANKCELRQALRAMTTISSREISPARNGCIYKSMTLAEEWEL